MGIGLVHHQQRTLNERQLLHRTATKNCPGLPVPCGQRAPLYCAVTVSHSVVARATICLSTIRKNPPGGRIEMDSPSGKRNSPVRQNIQAANNRHSCTTYRTPFLCSRGFLPWGLSDACLTDTELVSRALAGGRHLTTLNTRSFDLSGVHCNTGVGARPECPR